MVDTGWSYSLLILFYLYKIGATKKIVANYSTVALIKRTACIWTSTIGGKKWWKNTTCPFPVHLFSASKRIEAQLDPFFWLEPPTQLDSARSSRLDYQP